jgi:folate-binding protein YgfZ
VTPSDARAAEPAAALFRLERGLIHVGGGDRVRWLNGMLSNDVAALEKRGPGAGCYALLLTREGRILADLHVLLREDRVWLETTRPVVPHALDRLEKFVIADDVELRDESASHARFAIEGAGAHGLLEALVAEAAPASAVLPEPDGWLGLDLAGVEVVLARFSLAGGAGFQLLAPAASQGVVGRALLEIGAGRGLVPGEAGELERLRIEAGVPWLGEDLDETVLPDEARLEAAVSTTKGCYTGQEVVARMRSRGRVSHLLVGLRCRAPVAPGTGIEHEGRSIGEVTSAALSPQLGPIALGFVRVPHDAPGTDVDVGGVAARVAGLPFEPAIAGA